MLGRPLEQALTHLLKLHAMPDSPSAKHWRDEVRAFRHDLQRRFTPSMRQRIGLDDLYDKAAGRAQAAMEDNGVPLQPLPEACPFTLDDFLAGGPDVSALVARLDEAGADDLRKRRGKEVAMPDGLYEHDALAWAERQATLLRQLAAGERVNDAVDWPNVIEEVQDVGLSELRACRSLLRQTLVHLLKLHAWPDSSVAAHWRDEMGGVLDDAGQRFTPSMRQRVELDELYAKALRRAREATDDTGALRALPDACPFELDELLAGDLAGLAAKLDGTGADEAPDGSGSG